jgi:broad specificity phosphatase PhoE
MGPKIYLCRHADYTPSKAQELTETGKRHARELGEYIRNFVQPESAIFITSTYLRSLNTAELVAEGMNTQLTRKNHYSFRKLCETNIREYTDQSRLAHLKIDPKKLPTSKTVARAVSSRLIKVNDKHPDKSLIAILHGNINLAFLYNADDKKKRLVDYQMDYCELRELERKGAKIVPLEHTFRPLDFEQI